MVNFCGIVGCGNRADRDKGKSFYRIPGIINQQGPEAEQRSKHRREKWLALISREDLKEEKLPYVRVCNDHFAGGK